MTRQQPSTGRGSAPHPDAVHILTAFYFRPEPVSRTALFASVLEAVATDAELTPASLGASPRAIFASDYRDWTTRPGKQHGLGIETPQGAHSAQELADRIRRLPPDVGLLLVESRRRGARRTYDNWWHCEFQEAGRNAHQHHLDACVLGVFNTRLFRGSDGTTRARRLADALARVMATEPACYYGHIELADERDGCGGYIYSTTGIHPGPPLHRLHNSAVYWSGRTDRRRCVRGVYWGNFLGPALAARFDPDGLTTQRFLAFNGWQSDSTLKNDHYVTRFESGTMFVALSGSPMDASIGVSPADVQTSAWLHLEFRDRGMLA